MRGGTRSPDGLRLQDEALDGAEEPLSVEVVAPAALAHEESIRLRGDEVGEDVGALVDVDVYSLEVNDHYGFFIYNMSPREYADTLIRQFERLASEGEKSGTVMCIPLHSYLIGQPHRIGPFEEVLRHIAADGRAWIARAGEIVDSYRAQTGEAA